MKNRLPSFSEKKKICIICKGYEEYTYLKHLNSLGVKKGRSNQNG